MHLLQDSEVGSLVRDLASVFVTDPFEEFEDILEQSLRSLQTDDVKTWWNDRKKLDARLKVTPMFLRPNFIALNKCGVFLLSLRVKET